jgi:low affinity Fe/Cu permease
MRRKEKKSASGSAERMVDRVAAGVTHWAGSSWGFGMAAGTVLVWVITGPLFRWSDTWQLVINTGTTIVTFLMVFLVQRSQNRDGLAIQLKLNELVAALRGASNRLIDVEDLTEAELKILHAHYRRLVEMARADQDMTASHSIDEAENRHREKRQGGQPASSAAKKRETSSRA